MSNNITLRHKLPFRYLTRFVSFFRFVLTDNKLAS